MHFGFWGRGRDIRRKCVGCSFTSAIPNDLWDTSMTAEQVVVSDRQTWRFLPRVETLLWVFLLIAIFFFAVAKKRFKELVHSKVQHHSVSKTLIMWEIKPAGNWLRALRSWSVFVPPGLGCEAHCVAGHCAAVLTLPRRPGLCRPAATPGTSWWCTGFPKVYGSQRWGSLSIWAARTANPEGADNQMSFLQPTQQQEYRVRELGCNNSDINGSGRLLSDPWWTITGLDLGLVAFRCEIINTVMCFWIYGTNTGKIWPQIKSSVFYLSAKRNTTMSVSDWTNDMKPWAMYYFYFKLHI